MAQMSSSLPSSAGSCSSRFSSKSSHGSSNFHEKTGPNRSESSLSGKKGGPGATRMSRDWMMDRLPSCTKSSRSRRIRL
eukprot:5959043-Alexandrium_andersonii.AAC.1